VRAESSVEQPQGRALKRLSDRGAIRQNLAGPSAATAMDSRRTSSGRESQRSGLDAGGGIVPVGE